MNTKSVGACRERALYFFEKAYTPNLFVNYYIKCIWEYVFPCLIMLQIYMGKEDGYVTA